MRVPDEGVTRVGQLIILERLNRENVCVHDLLALDKSILKSPIKIISLDSSQTASIKQTTLSAQLAGSDGLRYKKPTRIGEDFFSFTSNHTHYGTAVVGHCYIHAAGLAAAALKAVGPGQAVQSAMRWFCAVWLGTDLPAGD